MMKKTIQPRKARKRAAKIVLRKGMGVHISKELKKKYKIRTIGLRKNDDVKIMRGEFKGKTGKVESVNLARNRVFVEGIQVQKVSGANVKIGIHPSNIIVTSIDMKDKFRKSKIERNLKSEPRKKEAEKTELKKGEEK